MTTRPPALLVEDHEEFASGLQAALSDRGLAIDVATGWTEGLELFRVNGYELVIADYNLPDTQHGLRLLLRMKRVMPATSLVLISGALTPNAERALQDVPLLDGYYSKSDKNLTSRLAEHVERASESASTPTDWQAVGAGYLADPDRDYPELDKIDKLLRADVERSG